MKEEIIGNESLVRTVDLYENERYQLSAMGWSAQGLLPTDRLDLTIRFLEHELTSP
jgi:hypothetical protein